MRQPLFILLAACFALTGCQLYQKSRTWDKVVHTRIDTQGSDDPSKTYATGLHRVLAGDRVPHKVVTYQFRHFPNLRDEVTEERTAVIYRDETNATYPWWIKDQARTRPVWLPNTDVARQVRFYIGREVQIVNTRDYSGGDGKTLLPVGENLASASAENVERFRALHGTEYDPASSIDRAKMQRLSRGRE